MMRDIFEKADTDGGGTVDREEFQAIVQQPETKAQFEALEIPAGDAEDLFDILDEEKEGELPIDKFVNGFMLLKGAAKSKDLMGVVVGTASLSRRLYTIETLLNELTDMLNDLPKTLDAAIKRGADAGGADAGKAERGAEADEATREPLRRSFDDLDGAAVVPPPPDLSAPLSEG